MKNLRNCYAAFLLFALLFVAAAAPAQTDLQQKLGRISAITETRPLESTRFSEKYVTYFTQPLDHRHPEKGSFRQRVIVSHVGFDRPTVIVTEGYGAAYALNPKYREELSELLDANMIFVEYRYFLESTPEPKDWQYLTAENSADDLHAVFTQIVNHPQVARAGDHVGSAFDGRHRDLAALHVHAANLAVLGILHELRVARLLGVHGRCGRVVKLPEDGKEHK